MTTYKPVQLSKNHYAVVATSDKGSKHIVATMYSISDAANYIKSL